MQIIKDLVLGLKAKIPLLQFITQQYSSNELFDFPPPAPPLGRFTKELSKLSPHVSKNCIKQGWKPFCLLRPKRPFKHLCWVTDSHILECFNKNVKNKKRSHGCEPYEMKLRVYILSMDLIA